MIRLPRTAVPDLCAVLNGGSALVLAAVLGPGTSTTPGADEAAYVAAHLGVWRTGWALWILAAAALVAFFTWWARRLARSSWVRLALGVGALGLICDVLAESLLIAGPPDRYLAAAPFAFRLTGSGANGLYSVAGCILAWRTVGLPRWLAGWSWTVWLLGLALALAVAAGSDAASRILTAALFVLLVPWLIVFGRRLG